MDKNIIKIIKETAFLKQAFFLDTSDLKDFNCMFVDENQKSEFNHIQWLYMSWHPYATLIGIMKDNSIFTIDHEFEQYRLCNSFFDIPFELVKLIIWDSEDIKKSLLEDPLYKQNLEDLKKYIQWCEENNFKLKKEDIDWINNE